MGASKPVLGFYDKPMWQGFSEGRFDMQQCDHCQTLRYPPGPACPHCVLLDFSWRDQVGQGGTIISWVVFHRQYLDDFPAPHAVIAVQFDAGPIVLTNLAGDKPEGDLTGLRVRFEIVDHQGRAQHAARVVDV
jgi:uncharacterized OB-fold protein